jgi:flagellar assembly factor FliW
MNCLEKAQNEAGNVTTKTSASVDANQGMITLPGGLLGFEKYRNFVLLGSPEEAPFLWLQMVDEPGLAFLVVSPSAVIERYQPDLSDEDSRMLELQSPEEALIFNIVTVHADDSATVNLKGPIVVNRRTLIGKQVIPQNAGNLSLQHAIKPIAQPESYAGPRAQSSPKRHDRRSDRHQSAAQAA